MRAGSICLLDEANLLPSDVISVVVPLLDRPEAIDCIFCGQVVACTLYLLPLPSTCALCPVPCAAPLLRPGSGLCPLPSTIYPLPSTLYPLPSTLYPLPSTPFFSGGKTIHSQKNRVGPEGTENSEMTSRSIETGR